MRINIVLLFIVVILGVGSQYSAAMESFPEFCARRKLSGNTPQSEKNVGTIAGMVQVAIDSQTDRRDAKPLLLDMYDHQDKVERLAYLIVGETINNLGNTIRTEVEARRKIGDFRDLLMRGLGLTRDMLRGHTREQEGVIEQSFEHSEKLLRYYGVPRYMYDVLVCRQWVGLEPHTAHQLSQFEQWYIRRKLERGQEFLTGRFDTMHQVGRMIRDGLGGESPQLPNHNLYDHQDKLERVTWLMTREYIEELKKIIAEETVRTRAVPDLRRMMDTVKSNVEQKVAGYYSDEQRDLMNEALRLTLILLRDAGAAEYIYERLRFRRFDELEIEDIGAVAINRGTIFSIQTPTYIKRRATAKGLSPLFSATLREPRTWTPYIGSSELTRNLTSDINLFAIRMETADRELQVVIQPSHERSMTGEQGLLEVWTPSRSAISTEHVLQDAEAAELNMEIGEDIMREYASIEEYLYGNENSGREAHVPRHGKIPTSKHIERIEAKPSIERSPHETATLEHHQFLRDKQSKLEEVEREREATLPKRDANHGGALGDPPSTDYVDWPYTHTDAGQTSATIWTTLQSLENELQGQVETSHDESLTQDILGQLNKWKEGSEHSTQVEMHQLLMPWDIDRLARIFRSILPLLTRTAEVSRDTIERLERTVKVMEEYLGDWEERDKIWELEGRSRVEGYLPQLRVWIAGKAMTDRGRTALVNQKRVENEKLQSSLVEARDKFSSVMVEAEKIFRRRTEQRETDWARISRALREHVINALAYLKEEARANGTTVRETACSSGLIVTGEDGGSEFDHDYLEEMILELKLERERLIQSGTKAGDETTRGSIRGKEDEWAGREESMRKIIADYELVKQKEEEVLIRLLKEMRAYWEIMESLASAYEVRIELPQYARWNEAKPDEITSDTFTRFREQIGRTLELNYDWIQDWHKRQVATDIGVTDSTRAEQIHLETAFALQTTNLLEDNGCQPRKLQIWPMLFAATHDPRMLTISDDGLRDISGYEGRGSIHMELLTDSGTEEADSRFEFDIRGMVNVKDGLPLIFKDGTRNDRYWTSERRMITEATAILQIRIGELNSRTIMTPGDIWKSLSQVGDVAGFRTVIEDSSVQELADMVETYIERAKKYSEAFQGLFDKKVYWEGTFLKKCGRKIKRTGAPFTDTMKMIHEAKEEVLKATEEPADVGIQRGILISFVSVMRAFDEHNKKFGELVKTTQVASSMFKPRTAFEFKRTRPEPIVESEEKMLGKPLEAYIVKLNRQDEERYRKEVIGGNMHPAVFLRTLSSWSTKFEEEVNKALMEAHLHRTTTP